MIMLLAISLEASENEKWNKFLKKVLCFWVAFRFLVGWWCCRGNLNETLKAL